MDFAFDIPNQESKGLEDAPPYLGLTASVGDERAIITGWDGSAYYLVGESGHRYHTSAIVWSVDELADPQVMDHNAKIASFLANREEGEAVYDDINGAWHLSSETIEKVSEEMEEADPAHDEEAQKILDAIEEYINGYDDKELDEKDQLALQAFPFVLLAAAVKDLDARDIPEVQDYVNQCLAVHGAIKEAILPLAVAAPIVGSELAPLAVAGAESIGARAALAGLGPKAAQLFNKIPGSQAAKPWINKGLQSLGLGQVANSLFGGGGSGEAPYVGRPYQYGLYSHRAHMNPNHLEFMLEKTAVQDDRLEALRAQVYAAIDAWAPAAQDQGTNNIWWLVQQGAEKAESFSDLQTVLEAIPAEYHNAIVQGTPLDGQSTEPLIPAGGAEVQAEPGSDLGPAAPSLGPAVPGGPPSGPIPGGPIPGAGPGPMGGGRTIPGGPVASVKKVSYSECPYCFSSDTMPEDEGDNLYCNECGKTFDPDTHDDLKGRSSSSKKTAEELFFEEIQPKIAYDPSMGVMKPGDADPANANAATGQPSSAEQQAKIQELAQQYIGQGEPVANAYNRAVLDYMQQITPPVTPPSSPGVPVAPGQMYSKVAYQEFIKEDGETRATLKCPNCGGQTIQYAGADYFHCVTCGNEWQYKFRTDKSSAKTSKWVDTDGKPLKTGQLYKMTSPEYPLADFVRVTWIEPENIRVAFENNDNEADIDTQEYRFERVDLDETPKTASVNGLEWLFDGNQVETITPPMTKEARKKFSPQEQRAFIDEPGVARNKDRLDLKGTHFNQSSYDGLVDLDPENPDAVSDDYIF